MQISEFYFICCKLHNVKLFMQKIGKHKYVKCRFERYRKLHLVYIIQKLKAQLQIFHKESNCKIRNTICRKAKWYTQDTEIINLQMEVCLWQVVGTKPSQYVFYAKFYKHQTCRKKSLLIKMPKQNESYSTIKNVCFKAIKAQKNPEL